MSDPLRRSMERVGAVSFMDAPRRRVVSSGAPLLKAGWGIAYVVTPSPPHHLVSPHCPRIHEEDALDYLYVKRPNVAIGFPAIVFWLFFRRVYKSLCIHRDIIKELLHRLSGSRFRQVIPASTVCATRFKFFAENRRFPVRCSLTPGCEEPGSFSHLLQCAGLGGVPRGVRPAYCAAKGNTGSPVPITRVEDGEIEIDFLPPHEGQGVSSDWTEIRGNWYPLATLRPSQPGWLAKGRGGFPLLFVSVSHICVG